MSGDRASELSQARPLAEAACCNHVIPDGYESADILCCLCTDGPCREVTAERASRHGWAWRWHESEAREREIKYVLLHGHRRPDPFGEDIPSDCTACQKAGENRG